MQNVSLNRSQGCRTSTSLGLCKSLFIQVSTGFRFSKITLDFTELGQIEGSNFFSLFNLLFVRLDLRLELINQSLHSFVVFTILIRGKLKLLDVTLRFSQILLTFSHASIFSFKFRLELTNPSFQFVHGFFASFKSVHVSFIQFSLQVLDLTFLEFAVPFQT